MAIVKEVDSINNLNHSSDSTFNDQLLHDMTLLIWTCQFDGKSFFSFEFLLSWQMKSSSAASVNKVMHELSAIFLPLMPRLFVGFVFLF